MCIRDSTHTEEMILNDGTCIIYWLATWRIKCKEKYAVNKINGNRIQMLVFWDYIAVLALDDRDLKIHMDSQYHVERKLLRLLLPIHLYTIVIIFLFFLFSYIQMCIRDSCNGRRSRRLPTVCETGLVTRYGFILLRLSLIHI